MTLAEAVELFWPEGPLTLASLRTAVRDGRLPVAVIAGKHLTTKAAVRSMSVCRPLAEAAGDALRGGPALVSASPPPASSTTRASAAGTLRHTLDTLARDVRSQRSGQKKTPAGAVSRPRQQG